MIIPLDILEKVKNSYAKDWEKIEKPLFLLFLEPKLTDSKWVERALWEVRKKYHVQYTTRQAVTNATPRIVLAGIRTVNSEAEVSNAIHEIASIFPRYECALASKFLHFCFPRNVPLFDQNAFATLCFNEEGRDYGLKRSRPPKSRGAIEIWIKAFKSFCENHLSEINKTRKEIINALPNQDKELGKKFITTYKVCDSILWVWGQ